MNFRKIFLVISMATLSLIYAVAAYGTGRDACAANVQVSPDGTISVSSPSTDVFGSLYDMSGVYDSNTNTLTATGATPSPTRTCPSSNFVYQDLTGINFVMANLIIGDPSYNVTSLLTAVSPVITLTPGPVVINSPVTSSNELSVVAAVYQAPIAWSQLNVLTTVAQNLVAQLPAGGSGTFSSGGTFTLTRQSSAQNSYQLNLGSAALGTSGSIYDGTISLNNTGTSLVQVSVDNFTVRTTSSLEYLFSRIYATYTGTLSFSGSVTITDLTTPSLSNNLFMANITGSTTVTTSSAKAASATVTTTTHYVEGYIIKVECSDTGVVRYSVTSKDTSDGATSYSYFTFIREGLSTSTPFILSDDHGNLTLYDNNGSHSITLSDIPPTCLHP